MVVRDMHEERILRLSLWLQMQNLIDGRWLITEFPWLFTLQVKQGSRRYEYLGTPLTPSPLSSSRSSMEAGCPLHLAIPPRLAKCCCCSSFPKVQH